MITGNVPGHLLAAARTGFLTGAAPTIPAYAAIATLIPMTTRNLDLVDLGAAPMPLRNRGRGVKQDFIEKKMQVAPVDWDIVVSISHNATQDDQTGELERKARSAGDNFQKHLAQQAFKALNDGDVAIASNEFGGAYDALPFYDDSHVDKGAAYSTVQDNKHNLALSLDNFETVRVTAKNVRDDQGEFTDYNYDLLVAAPASERIASNITQNPQDYGTTNRAANPYSGNTRYVVTPKFDSTAWVLVASSESHKPILIAMREQPNLQIAWFDPNGPDGGTWNFKFFARYNHFYGDWRLALMGKS